MKHEFITRLCNKDNEPQFLLDHLEKVSIMGGQLADKVGLKEVGGVLGLVNDLGKDNLEFKSYLCYAEGLINPNLEMNSIFFIRGHKVDNWLRCP